MSKQEKVVVWAMVATIVACVAFVGWQATVVIPARHEECEKAGGVLVRAAHAGQVCVAPIVLPQDTTR